MAGITSPWANRRDMFFGQSQPVTHGITRTSVHGLLAALDKAELSISKMAAVRPAEVYTTALQALDDCKNKIRPVITQPYISQDNAVQSANQKETAVEESVNTPSLK